MGVREWARKQAAEYSNGEDRPLGGYLTMLGLYGGWTGGMVVAGRLAGKRFPKHVDAGDVALLAIASNYISRTLAKDPITSPLRAPFTRFDGVSGPSMLKEQVRGHGLQHSVGEMLSCPLCLAQWVATAFAGGLVFAPRATRFAMALTSAVWGADFLQYLLTWLEQQAEG
jgi:hypothetical protein